MALAWVAAATDGLDGADLALRLLGGGDACWAATATALAAKVIDAAAERDPARDAPRTARVERSAKRGRA